MKRIPLFSSSRLPVLVLILICLTLASVGMRVSALKGNANDPLPEETKKILQAQLRSGIGEQVRLDKVKNSPGHIRQAVKSAAGFMENRSGLILSENVKNRLVVMEQATLAGQSRRVSMDDFVDILTVTAIERLSSVSDYEIAQAKATFLDNGDIRLRAGGRGYLEEAEFDDKVKLARDLCRQGDETFKGFVRAAVREEVTSRVNIYSEALPGHFGKAKHLGITPLQAMLITYSVVSDDFMSHSQSTLDAMQEQVYEIMKDQGYKRGRRPNKSYGSDGYRYATPLDMILNETTINNLLDRIGERGAQ